MRNLQIVYDYDELMDEFFFFVDSPGKLSLKNSRNKIVKFFQQDVFYKKEKELWKNDNVKVKLIQNRCKYLNKTVDELTVVDILSGFKISSIYYGYSMFNPLLAKWFYERYNIKSCYDPCGGWGHRMLGSTNLDLYIYNDVSSEVCENIQNMKKYFDMYNVTIYNEDACQFVPKEDFESIFTCPPYKDLEKYNNDVNFETLIEHIYELYKSKETCRYLGIVMREDMMFLKDYKEKIELKNSTSHLNKNKQHRFREFLYIWCK